MLAIALVACAMPVASVRGAVTPAASCSTTWVQGLSHLGGIVFLLDDARQVDHQRLAWFDVESGDLLGELNVAEPSEIRSGLTCLAAPL